MKTKSTSSKKNWREYPYYFTDERKAKVKQYYLDHKEEYRKRSREWKKKNPEKARAIVRKTARTVKGRYNNAKCTAKRTDRSWDMPFDIYEYLISLPCVYCDGPLSETGSGLDRIRNEYGYEFWNVMPCCKVCNSIKGEHLTYNEMKAAMMAVKFIREYKESKPTAEGESSTSNRGEEIQTAQGETKI